MHNSILWADTGGEIYNDPGHTSSTITIAYSLAQGCKPAGVWNTAVCGADGGTNVTDSDPMFKDPDNENFRLTGGSPAINRGNNAFVNGVTTDLAGNPRISGGVVDLGPYEFPLYSLFLPVIMK